MGSILKVQNYIKYLQKFCRLLLAQIHHKHKRLILQRPFLFYISTLLKKKVQSSILLSISSPCCRMKQMFIWMKRLYQHPQPSLVWCFSLCTFWFGDTLMFFSADPVQLRQLWLDHVHMWRHFWVFPRMFDLSQLSSLSTGGHSPFWFLIHAYGHSQLCLQSCRKVIFGFQIFWITFSFSMLL